VLKSKTTFARRGGEKKKLGGYRNWRNRLKAFTGLSPTNLVKHKEQSKRCGTV